MISLPADLRDQTDSLFISPEDLVQLQKDTHRTNQAVGELLGLKVFVNPFVPKGIVILRDSKGNIVGIINIGTQEDAHA